MAFEKRSTPGRAYLYLSRRDPATGKVRKVYIGLGRRAEAEARNLALRRKQREDDKLAITARRAELLAVDELMEELDGAAAVLLEAALLAAGFHRPNFGPWRKRRIANGH
jgi:hypothetical protein